MYKNLTQSLACDLPAARWSLKHVIIVTGLLLSIPSLPVKNLNCILSEIKWQSIIVPAAVKYTILLFLHIFLLAVLLYQTLLNLFYSSQ